MKKMVNFTIDKELWDEFCRRYRPGIRSYELQEMVRRCLIPPIAEVKASIKKGKNPFKLPPFSL